MAALLAPAAAAAPERIALRSGGRTILLQPAEIIWARADRNYTRIATRSMQIRIRGSIGVVATLLERFGFHRIHRSVVINLREVTEVRGTGRRQQVILGDGSVLTLSAECKESFLKALGLDSRSVL